MGVVTAPAGQTQSSPGTLPRRDPERLSAHLVGQWGCLGDPPLKTARHAMTARPGPPLENPAHEANRAPPRLRSGWRVAAASSEGRRSRPTYGPTPGHGGKQRTPAFRPGFLL